MFKRRFLQRDLVFTAVDLDREPTVRPAKRPTMGEQPQAARIAVAKSAVGAGIHGWERNYRMGNGFCRWAQVQVVLGEGPVGSASGEEGVGSSTVVSIRALLRSSERSGRSGLRHVCKLIKSVLYKDATDGCGR